MGSVFHSFPVVRIKASSVFLMSLHLFVGYGHVAGADYLLTVIPNDTMWFVRHGLNRRS